MSAMDTEAARIRAVVHEWAERVKRGEKMPRYGFGSTSHWGGKWAYCRGFRVPDTNSMYIKEEGQGEQKALYWRTSIESGWVQAERYDLGKGER